MIAKTLWELADEGDLHQFEGLSSIIHVNMPNKAGRQAATTIEVITNVLNTMTAM